MMTTPLMEPAALAMPRLSAHNSLLSFGMAGLSAWLLATAGLGGAHVSCRSNFFAEPEHLEDVLPEQPCIRMLGLSWWACTFHLCLFVAVVAMVRADADVPSQMCRLRLALAARGRRASTSHRHDATNATPSHAPAAAGLPVEQPAPPPHPPIPPALRRGAGDVHRLELHAARTRVGLVRGPRA
jgi:hypothetical protein